ncbi:plasmid stabilization system [Salinisphaera sp. T5B8]|uniref:type II toxin-antitoxin system RelE/ParE family toxin n=1 Tax=Salinisphaera TaxID=180541 RepID=UPI000A079D20
MKPTRFIAAARDEFLAALAYYRDIDPELARRFSREVEEVLQRAVAFPESGSPSAANTRRMYLRDFPFALVYRATDSAIVVFALAHHSRRPGYWRDRGTPP